MKMTEEQLAKLISKIGLCTFTLSIEIMICWIAIVFAIYRNGPIK